MFPEIYSVFSGEAAKSFFLLSTVPAKLVYLARSIYCAFQTKFVEFLVCYRNIDTTFFKRYDDGEIGIP